MADIEDKVDVKDVLDSVEKKTEEFTEILTKIEYASPETKKLWREIYQNAFDDRSHAYLLFADLYRAVSNSPEGHNIHGKLMAAYLERMNKANDQLLKLAELIQNEGGGAGEIDAEALYDELTADKASKK